MINKMSFFVLAFVLNAGALGAQLNLPVVNLGSAPVASVESVVVDSGSVETPSIQTGNVESVVPENGSAPEVSVESVAVETPSIQTGDNRIAAVQAFQKKLKSTFRDQRNVVWDQTARYDSRAWEKWIQLYQKQKPYTIVYKELPEGLRIISEVKCPQGAEDWAALEKNLAYYQKAGYNGVLLTFTMKDPLPELLKLCDFLKARKWKIVFAFAGAEKLEETAFPDPDELEKYLAALGLHCDALLLGWRRTSLHLLTPDRQYINHLVKSARSANGDLPVIGMAYFGATAESNHKLVSSYSIPEGVSAVLMINIGYPFKDMKKVIEQRFPKIKDLPKIGQALGPWPYYDSRFKMKKSFEEIQKIKRYIEQKMLSAGCVGTLTMRGDGSDGVYYKSINENLCKPYPGGPQ